MERTPPPANFHHFRVSALEFRGVPSTKSQKCQFYVTVSQNETMGANKKTDRTFICNHVQTEMICLSPVFPVHETLLQPSVQVFGPRREMALMEYFRRRHRCSIYAMTIPRSPTLHFAEHSIVDLTGLILRSSCVTGWVLHDLPARHSGSPPRNCMG